MSELLQDSERIQKKRDIVKSRISSCAKNAMDATYFYENLPDKIFYKIRNIYGFSATKEEVLGMIDDTLTHNGKTGLLLTLKGIYYRRMMESAGFISYSDAVDNPDILRRKLGDDFNISHLKELVNAIKAVDRYTPDELISTANEAIQKLDTTVQKGREVLELFKNTVESWKK